MKRIHRRDRFRIDATAVVRHPNGWLDVWGVATRVGVFDYPEIGTKEWRPPDEVMNPSSISSLLGAPITLDHPPDDVTSANYRDLAHGSVFDVKPEGDLVYTHIRFGTDDALDAIRAGVVELSCGYDADYYDEAGTAPDGTPYTGVQRNIRYNHLALVDAARAGHVARIRLDSERRARKDGAHAMKKIKIGNRYLDVAPFVVAHWQAEAAKHTELARTDKKRADEIAVTEVTIEGQTLILPKALVDQFLAMIGGTGASEPPPTDADPMPEDDPPLEDSRGGPPGGVRRGDTRTSSADVQRRVDAHVADALGRERVRATIERKATTILGEGHDYTDGWAAAAAAIARVNEARKDAATAFATAAKATRRDGQPTLEAAQAQGRLLSWLDDAVEARRDALDSSGDLGSIIDSARRNADGTPAKRTDKVADAHAAMRARIHNAGKPPKPTGAAA